MCTEAELNANYKKLETPVVVRVTENLRHKELGYLKGKRVQLIGFYDADSGRICLIKDGQRIKHQILMKFLKFDITSPQYAEVLAG